MDNDWADGRVLFVSRVVRNLILRIKKKKKRGRNWVRIEKKTG
jgi:hypothetical protein